MRTRTTIIGLLIAILANVLVSCEAFHSKKKVDVVNTAERKALKRVTLPPDSVVFDVLLARIPYQDRDLATEFWKDVDEMEIEPETRKRLNEQGFRVGVVGASPPETLSQLLALKGRELRESIEEEVDFSKAEAATAPITSSKPVTLRVGMKSMIETRSDVCPSIPILENKNGALIGKSYTDARTTLSVSIEQNPDGSVKFNLSPLLKYGAPQGVTRYQYGQLVRTQEQPTKSFDQLKFSASLRPGQFLVLGATDAHTNALGKFFFTDGGEDFDQKLLVLRLLVTQHDGQFDRFPDFKTLTSRVLGEENSNDDAETKFDYEPELEEDAIDFSDYELEEVETNVKPSKEVDVVEPRESVTEEELQGETGDSDEPFESLEAPTLESETPSVENDPDREIEVEDDGESYRTQGLLNTIPLFQDKKKK